MKKGKRDSPVDRLPLQLPDSMSGYERESQEAEAKLADVRKQAKKKKKSLSR
jgi:hypothetical protein